VDPRESKLPKWAQSELSTLRRELSIERQRNAELRGDVPNANTFVLDYGHESTPLPRDARVQFDLRKDDGRVRQSIQCYVESGMLRIQGDYSLILHPRASNSFFVELENYR
jgi:hypothetical protein